MSKEPIIKKCEGCARIEEINGTIFCSAYPRPYYKWRLGDCPLCTTIHKMEGETGKKRVGQQKSKKKSKTKVLKS